MPPRQTEEEQADFVSALQSVADEAPMPQAEVDSLSMLEGPDLDRFREIWKQLPAGARARLLRALHGAAEQRLRLDFSALNQLALEDVDARVRLAGVQCALEDRSTALLARLLALLRNDPQPDVRAAAAEDLARFALLAELEDLDADAASDVRAGLLDAVRDEAEHPRVRSSALASLGYFSDAAMMQELANAFTTPELRLGAVRGMGRSADPRWTDRLMPVLGADDPQMRTEAARALGEIEDERAVTPLIEAIDDSEREVRLAVIEALGHIGGDEAREALLYTAEDADEPVRQAAEKALEEIEEVEEDPLDL
jgi:HEAT repeat protein